MSNGRLITLTEAEQRIVTWVAKTRYEECRKAGVTNGRIGSQSDEETDKFGFGAEVAFCKLFNVYPDFTTNPRKGGADCERFGMTIDVKTTTWQNGKLLVAVRHKREFAADVFALLICDWPTYRFAGFASADELLSEGRLIEISGVQSYAMTQGELWQEQPK